MAKKITKQEKKVVKYAIALAVLILFILSIFKVGALGTLINNLITFIFGDFYLIYFIIACLLYAKKYIFKSRKKLRFTLVLSIIILCVALLLENSYHYYNINKNTLDFKNFKAMSLAFENLKSLLSKDAVFYGGIIGATLFSLIYQLLGGIGTLVICVLLFVTCIFVLIPADIYKKIYGYLYSFFHEARLEIKHIILENYRAQYQEYLNSQNNSDEETLEETKEDVIEEPTPDEELSSTATMKMPTVDDIFKEDEEETVQEPVNSDVEEVEIVAPKRVSANPFAGYKIPSLKILEKAVSLKSDKNQTNAEMKGRKLIEILRTFGIKASLINIHIGPSVTKFEIKPDASVNLNKINALQDNLKMELAAKEIRIEAPIPGRNAVGIEIPNVENGIVKLSELLMSMPANLKNNPLVFALGKDLMDQATFCEINKMPHLLIGGATGSGKSVCINALITSIIMRTRPDDVKLVLIDPKKVEFTPYHDIPHLLWPVITDAKMASNLLVKVVTIMKERYDLFSAAGARDITSYNNKVKEHNASSSDKMEKLPYIVVVIDELADLMLVAGKEVETSIQRITQLSRASGIHLVVATQRPSTDVITGLIKSNINSRIAFMTSSAIDSRTILDQAGADRLLGNGDMLYKPQGENAPIRLQGCYVSDQEIQTITNEVKKFKPQYDDTYYELERCRDDYNSSNGTDGGDDELYEEAVEHIRKTQKASTSSLQRRFGIGYNRAARIIDTLEARGVIGPANGSKPREVYIKKEAED